MQTPEGRCIDPDAYAFLQVMISELAFIMLGKYNYICFVLPV